MNAGPRRARWSGSRWPGSPLSRWPRSPLSRWQRAAVALLFAGVVAALLVPSPFEGRAATTSFDLLHFPCFAAFSVAVLAMAHRLGGRSLGHRVGVAVAVLAFAAAMEALQRLSGRSPTMHDLLANTAGVVSGWMLYESWRQPQAMLRVLALTLTAALLVYTSYRPALTLWDLWQQSPS